MSTLSAVRHTAGFVVRHPARTTLRLAGAVRGAARVVVLGPPEQPADHLSDRPPRPPSGTVVPPSEPGLPPIPAPQPDAPGPISPPEPMPQPDPGPIDPGGPPPLEPQPVGP